MPSIDPTTAYSIGPSRKGTRRVLAVRALVARSGWLDGHLRWQDGRVVWEHDRAFHVPTSGDVAQAYRSHNQIRRYPISADLALGDHQAWLAYRTARLALAKRLLPLYAPDLPGLIRQARSGSRQALAQLAELLPAEALCINALPRSPSAALVACGPHSAPYLAALLAEQGLPALTHALAALALGALHGTARHVTPSLSDPWVRRAYSWGAAHALPADPALMVRVLAEDDGIELAERLEKCGIDGARQADKEPRTKNSEPYFSDEQHTRKLQTANHQPPATSYQQANVHHPSSIVHGLWDIFRELLACGHTPAAIVALAEAVAEAEPLMARLRSRRGPGAATKAERAQTNAALSDAIHEASKAGDPATVRALLRLADLLLDLDALGTIPEAALLVPIQSALTLPTPLIGAGMTFLAEIFPQIYDRATFKPTRRKPRPDEWLATRWETYGQPLLQFLSTCESLDTLRGLSALGIAYSAAQLTPGSPDDYRWLATTVTQFDPMPAEPHLAPNVAEQYLNERRNLAYELWNTVQNNGGRAALQPLIDVLGALPPTRRGDALTGILDELRRVNELSRDSLGRVARHGRQIVRFMRKSTQFGYTGCWILLGMLTLDRTYPEIAEARLSWVIDELIELERLQGEDMRAGSISVTTLLAAVLSDGHEALFTTIFRTGMAQRFEQNQHQLEQGILAVGRLPGLRRALSHILPQQPQRCADMILNVGRAARLGPEVLAPLKLLEQDVGNGALLQTEQSDWAEAFALAPELAGLAGEYHYSLWLLGRPFDIPAGVRQALGQPLTTVRELAHLDRMIAANPERLPLIKRAHNLRARLADNEQLLRAARNEAFERLSQVSALVRLEAAEHLAEECYRARLGQIIGMLPSDLVIDDDLINIAILSIDIEENRALLRQLLRSHLHGQSDWREQIPANATFLAELAARGTDPSRWLSSWPRQIRLSGERGSTIHLSLETSPARVLQMGNLFDTCLSIGGINAYSTVTNACELNKRVLYVRNESGQIIARKLIAISTSWQLVGFRLYSQAHSDTARQRLSAAVRRYLADFAELCGLALANDGEVQTLFAARWYDDGCVAWDDSSSTDK